MALRSEQMPAADTPTLDEWLSGLTARSHHDAVRASTAEVAATLQELFGQRLVAFMTGVEDPKAVGRWARRERAPRDRTEQRLRDAFQIARLLTLADSADTARAWFIGMNPHFGDRAPFAILGEQPEESPRVLAAAKAFVAGN
jgi:hypothetical protein